MDITVVDGIGITDLENQSQNDIENQSDFEFHLETTTPYTKIKIEMEEPVDISNFAKPIKVLVTWQEKMTEEYDISYLNQLPEVYKPVFMQQLAQDSVSLYKCVEAFLKEEPLGPEDMWYLSIEVFFFTSLACFMFHCFVKMQEARCRQLCCQDARGYVWM